MYLETNVGRKFWIMLRGKTEIMNEVMKRFLLRNISTSEAILYPSGIFGLHGGWIFGFVDRLDDGNLMMMKKFENGYSKTVKNNNKEKTSFTNFCIIFVPMT